MRLFETSVIIAICAVAQAPLRAEEPECPPMLSKEAVRDAVKIVAESPWIKGLVWLDFLDQVTKSKSRLEFKDAPKKPVPERSYFMTEFLVRDVEFETSMTNRAFGREVPGRRIAANIKVDCNVECRIDVAHVRLQPHERYKDTFLLILPNPEIVGRVPAGRVYHYEIDYGAFRSSILDSENAQSLRESALYGVSGAAERMFREGPFLAEFRKGLKKQLDDFLWSTLPKEFRITILFEDELEED
jgi:hypothetical protein